MRRVRSRLTILLLILVIVTSLFSLTFGALVRNGIIFQQRDNIRYLVFGYAAKDILLLLIAVAAVAVLITVTSRSTTNPIRELSRAAREIAGGNYDVTVPERDRVEEFGELERNFNLMTAELRSNEYLRKDFISSVSHQLKTPLSILNGYAQLLAEGGLSETEEREYSQYIAQESDRLVGLIDDMLRLSRIDHREIQRKAEIFPLGEQLRRAVLQLAPRWTEAGLSVSADIPDLDYVGDSELLYQVWVNLLENAVKFTPPGGRIGICLAAAADTVTVTVWAAWTRKRSRAFLSSSIRARPTAAPTAAGWVSRSASASWSSTAERSPRRAVPERAAASASRCRQRPQNSCKETP